VKFLKLWRHERSLTTLSRRPSRGTAQSPHDDGDGRTSCNWTPSN
jgi:hypothetical protein